MYSPWLLVYLFPVVFAVGYLSYVRVTLYIRRRRFSKKFGCKTLRRAPQKEPFLALDHFFRLAKAAKERRYLEHFERWFSEVGPTFGVNLMGDDMVFTNEPKNIQAVLVTNFPDFEIGQRRRDNSAELLGVGVFNADGQTWERGRALVRPNFTRKQVSDLQLFEKHVRVMMESLPSDGTPVEIQDWVFRFTLDTGTEVLFSESSNVLRKDATDIAQRFAWAFNVGVDGIAQRIRLGKFARFYYDPEYKEACKVVHNYIDVIVQKAIDRAQEWHSKTKGGKEKLDDDERYTFLNALARDGVGAKEMRDQVLNILVAARDTSACLMSAALYELAKRPEIQRNLRHEVTKLGGRLPTFEDIKDMKYLNHFIKETLRLYPPIPLNARVACNDTFLPRGGGPDGLSPIFIPKGTLVVYQIYSMHRRPDIWGADADEFKPERWETSRPTFEFLPFNAGPRICPGQQFALVETSYVIIRFLQEYSKIEARDDGGPWTENLTLTCSVGQGVFIALNKNDHRDP